MEKKILSHFDEDESKGWADCGRTWNTYETRRFPIMKTIHENVYTCEDCGAVIENY